MSKKVFIFDFDGVLVDSVNIKTEAFALLYEKHGKSIVDKVKKHHLLNGGMSRHEKFVLYETEFLKNELDQNVIEELSERFANLVFNKIVKISEVDGVKEILDYCDHNQIICAIVSATPESEIKKIISHRNWTRRFTYVFGSPKSKETNIRKVLKLTKSDTSQILFFGDSKSDKNAAQKCCIDFVPINYMGSNDYGFRKFLSTV